MKKKQKKTKIKVYHRTESGSLEDRIMRELMEMKHKDLQKACIRRGMTAEEVVNSSHPKLVSFFSKNFEVSYSPGEERDMLRRADDWMKEQLTQRGYKTGDALMHPTLSFSYVEGANNGIEKLPVVKSTHTPEKPPTPKEDKPKRTVDEETGVVKGTKKNMVYELALKGVPLDKIIEKVMEKFPDAKDKSIKIWYKRVQTQGKKK